LCLDLLVRGEPEVRKIFDFLCRGST